MLLYCEGAHTRSISVATPSSASGGIMRFAKVKMTCLSCKAPLAADARSSLCKHCSHREPEIYARSLTTVNQLEQQFGRCLGPCVCGLNRRAGCLTFTCGWCPYRNLLVDCKCAWNLICECVVNFTLVQLCYLCWQSYNSVLTAMFPKALYCFALQTFDLQTAPVYVCSNRHGLFTCVYTSD